MTAPPQHGEPPIRATNLRPIGKGPVKATVDIEVPPWRLAFRGCLWFQKDGKEWINLPSRAWTDRAGNRKFSNLIEFTDRSTSERFQQAALAAVHELAGGAP